MTMTRAIVVSGATHGLGVVRSLGRQGVPVTVVSYDRRDIAQRSKYVGDVIRVPHPDKDEAQFVKVLLETAHRCPGSVLIPASDAALGAVARHKTILEDAGLIVASVGGVPGGAQAGAEPYLPSAGRRQVEPGRQRGGGAARLRGRAVALARGGAPGAHPRRR